MLKCPFCGNRDTKVLDSRPTEDSTSIRRRRECFGCAKRFTTYEKVEDIPIFIIKRDGSREPFSKRKILNGVLKSCEKRPISISDIEDLVDKIEKEVQSTMNREISSTYIGEVVMDKLKDFDDVAYVRFASVYKQFKDVNTFLNELQKILDGK